jgi:membrane protease YdiL (CAAX protease family)
MSTLAAATQPATQAASASADVPWIALWLMMGFLGSVSLVLTIATWFLGGFRPGMQGPSRIATGQPFWPVAIGLAAAFVGLIVGGAIGYAVLEMRDPGALAEEVARPPSDVLQTDDAFSSRQMVRMMQISAVSYAGATGAALLSLLIARALGWSGGIGLGATNLGRGLITGALAAVLVIPWMLTAAVGLQVVRKLLGYPLDAAHELIRALQEHPEAEMIAWGIISAVVIAPLAEEILFRGFLQTTLVYGLARLSERSVPEAVEAMDAGIVPDVGGVMASLPYAPVPVHRAMNHPPPARWRWGGIILTSIVFACLHEAWSIPLIFLLSLALGYVYERTGSLWTPILVHFAFNTVNLMLVLPSILFG